MIPLLAVAAAALLVQVLLAGTAAGLGLRQEPLAAAMLVAAVGVGLRSRRRVPYLSDGVALALLVPLRGPIADVLVRALPAGRAALLLAAAASLLPVGFVLGRLLHPCLRGGLSPALLGVALSYVAVSWWGAGALLPAWLLGAAVAAALTAGREALRGGQPEHLVGEARDGSCLRAALCGFAIGALGLVLARVVPAYVGPGPHAGTDIICVLTAPVALLAALGRVVASAGPVRRLLAGAGGVVLAVLLVLLIEPLALYREAMIQVDLTRKLALWGGRGWPLIDDWRLWLAMFAARPLIGAGLALATLDARSAGALFLGVGAALAATVLTDVAPQASPALMLLSASGAALVAGVIGLAGRRGAWAAPLAAVPFLLVAPESRPSFDEVRRPGEFTIEAFERAPLEDVVLFSTPDRDSHSLEGRAAWKHTCTCLEPVYDLDESGQLVERFTGGSSHDDEERGGPSDPRRCYGLRIGGRTAFAGATPIGPGGGLARLTRLFARPGRTLVAGRGAELLAADLNEAGLASETRVASPTPFGSMLTRILLEAFGSSGWQAGRVLDPAVALREASPGEFDTIVLVGALDDHDALTAEALGRARELLGPGGRCLAWIDASDVDAAALGARLAAFASAFGAASAAFVEMRELDAPLVALVGWADETGRLDSEELHARLARLAPAAGRTRLRDSADLAALLLLDGSGMSALEASAPAHRGARMILTAGADGRGWAALADLPSGSADFSTVAVGGPPSRGWPRALLRGLAIHSSYEYRVGEVNEMLLEIRPDVDWAAFEREVEQYAQVGGDDPRRALALEALLEPLALYGDFGRFADVWERTSASELPSVRLALLKAVVLRSSLEVEAAEQELQRAAQLRRAELRR